jgi:protein phosphatase
MLEADEPPSGHPSTIDAIPASAPRPVVRLRCGATSHVGKVRTNNEDQYQVLRLSKAMEVLHSGLSRPTGLRMSEEKAYVLLVADGLGGHLGGERASALVAEWVEANLLDLVKLFFHFGERDERERDREIQERLEELDHLIRSEAYADRSLENMGTTLTMAYSVGADLMIIHVGDSRAYVYSEWGLQQVTHDHTLAQMMADVGMIRPEEVRENKRRNIVTNVLGGPSAGVRAEIHRVVMEDGDRLLLCTDGLNDVLDDVKIAALLERNPEPDAACRALVDATLDAGAPDNVTVIVADYIVEKP